MVILCEWNQLLGERKDGTFPFIVFWMSWTFFTKHIFAIENKQIIYVAKYELDNGLSFCAQIAFSLEGKVFLKNLWV